MAKPVRMHVARTPSKHVDKAGTVRRYESVLVRRTYRDGAKVRHETLANLSKLPAEVIAAVEATLKGQPLVPAEAVCTITRSLPHGHVAAVVAMAHRLGLPTLLGPAGRSRDLALGLIIARVVRPTSKLSTLGWWSDCTLGEDLDVAGASTDEIYAAMDRLVERQNRIEKKLAAKHLGPEVNPGRMALFDLTSSWVTGHCCELAARGYSRDGKKGLPQIEYGVLTDPAGRPVAVRVLSGNTADPTASTDIVEVIRTQFGLTRLVLVGDRGMITCARIGALNELNDDAGERGRVGGVARQYPHRHRAPGRVGEHPVVYLWQAFLAVARITAGGQLTTVPGHPRAGQIEQRYPARIHLWVKVFGC